MVRQAVGEDLEPRCRGARHRGAAADRSRAPGQATAGDLDWIAARTLEKDPARRYPTVSDLSADLRRHLNSEPVLARPPDLRYRVGRFVRRHRVAVAAGAMVTATVLVAGVISATSWVQTERARRDTRARLKAFHVDRGLSLADAGDDLRALPWLVRALELEEGASRPKRPTASASITCWPPGRSRFTRGPTPL